MSNGRHFGCRIAQTPDNNLILTMGDHGSYPQEAQNLGNHLGKIVRVTPDGAVPNDNPFVDRKDAKPEIWSYGNRNVQGAALHPDQRQALGARARPAGRRRGQHHREGQELRLAGDRLRCELRRREIHDAKSKAGMEQPMKYWVPSIAPSGMAFYSGALFPAWKGNLIVGALTDEMMVRLTLNGEKVTGEERMLQGVGERIRDVRVGPDGAIYLATDSSNGRIVRVSPAK